MARSKSGSAEPDHQFKLADSPSHLLYRAEQLAADRFTHLVGDAITLRQFILLAAIAEQPGLTQTELGRIAGVDRSTLADTMAKMEQREWVVRTPSTRDGRAYSVFLGDPGGVALSATAQHARAADAAILDLLTKAKGRGLISTLTKLGKLADAAAVKAEHDQAKRKTRERAAEKKAKALSRKQRS